MTIRNNVVGYGGGWLGGWCGLGSPVQGTLAALRNDLARGVLGGPSDPFPPQRDPQPRILGAPKATRRPGGKLRPNPTQPHPSPNSLSLMSRQPPSATRFHTFELEARACRALRSYRCTCPSVLRRGIPSASSPRPEDRSRATSPCSRRLWENIRNGA